MALAYEAATLRDAMLDAITTRAGSAALLRIYDGSRPATVWLWMAMQRRVCSLIGGPAS